MAKVVFLHQRRYLDLISAHSIVFEGDSRTRLFIGNWSDYEAACKSNLAQTSPRTA